MSEIPLNTHEATDQPLPSMGFNYEKLSIPGEWAEQVIVSVFRTPDKATYLVPINGADDERWQERVRALQTNDIPCHLLPSGADQYSAQEKHFAQQTLGQPAGETKAPFAPRLRKEEALVFDPTSPKSMLDVMIATGHDSPDIRKARLAALHGEANATVDTLRNLLDFGAYGESGDARAHALQIAYDFYDKVSFIDIVEQLTEKGTDAFRYTRIQQRVAEGVEPKLVESAVTHPDQIQQVATDGWKQMIDFARVHNKDLSRGGIYTELHRIGGVLVALPAIASTAWAPVGEALSQVAITGDGHTLAENYKNDAPQKQDLSRDLIDFMRTTPLRQLSKKLGILTGGRSTLQRRCLTTFDDEGKPVIHLREGDPYNGRRGKMTNEEVRFALSAQMIRNDLADEKGTIIEAAHEFDGQVIVDVQKSIEFTQPRFSDEAPIACITRIDTSSEVPRLAWTYGYAPMHEALFHEAGPNDDPEAGIPVQLGDETVYLRATYTGHHDQIEGKQQFILWAFHGDPAVVAGHADTLKTMIHEANQTIAQRMSAEWGVSPEELYADVWLQNSATGQYGPLKLE